MSEVQTSLSYFLRRQMLFLASAGESAFGTLSRPDLPQGVARWFHMSVSKNTVARFAMERDHLRTTAAEPSGGDAAAEPRGGAGAGTLKEEETLLINLDADNVMAEQYPKSLMKAAEPGYQRGLVVWKTLKNNGWGGICGRVACFLRDGLQVGMYDEEPGVVGSGSQDIDFKDRVLALTLQVEHRLVRLPQVEIGICLENTMPDMLMPGSSGSADSSGAFAANWDWAKICNCDPDDIRQFGTWAKFNANNTRAFDKKWKTGSVCRNSGQFGASFKWLHDSNWELSQARTQVVPPPPPGKPGPHRLLPPPPPAEAPPLGPPTQAPPPAPPPLGPSRAPPAVLLVQQLAAQPQLEPPPPVEPPPPLWPSRAPPAVLPVQQLAAQPPLLQQTRSKAPPLLLLSHAKAAPPVAAPPVPPIVPVPPLPPQAVPAQPLPEQPPQGPSLGAALAALEALPRKARLHKRVWKAAPSVPPIVPVPPQPPLPIQPPGCGGGRATLAQPLVLRSPAKAAPPVPPSVPVPPLPPQAVPAQQLPEQPPPGPTLGAPPVPPIVPVPPQPPLPIQPPGCGGGRATLAQPLVLPSPAKAAPPVPPIVPVPPLPPLPIQPPGCGGGRATLACVPVLERRWGVVILTMGLRFVGERGFTASIDEDRHHIQLLRASHLGHFTPENTVAHALEAARIVPCGPLSPPTIAVDCRMFPDPGGRATGINHLGFHPRVICGVVRHSRFPGWVTQLKRRLRREELQSNAAAPGPGPVHLCFYCLSGRHRSVACSVIVTYILEGLGQYNIVRTDHLAAHRWFLRTCNGCTEFQSSSQELRIALQDAADLWTREA